MAGNAIRPKLVVADADAAIDFYTQVLGAELLSCYRYDGTVVFAELEIFGCSVTLKDSDGTDTAAVAGERGALLDVVVDDPDSIAAAMIEAGADTIFPIADQLYGARGGRVLDPHGVQWLLQTPVGLSPDEWDRVVEEMQSS